VAALQALTLAGDADQLSGVAEEKTTHRLGPSAISATQPPFDIVANELFQEFGPVRCQEAAKCFVDDGFAVPEPSVFHQDFDLLIQLVRDSDLDRFHEAILLIPEPRGCLRLPTKLDS
jgi:hypothetical protein